MVDPPARGCGDRRLGAKGDAEPGGRSIGRSLAPSPTASVADCGTPHSAASADQRVALGVAGDDRRCDGSGDAAVGDVEPIGNDPVEPEFAAMRSAKTVNPPETSAVRTPSRPRGRDQRPRPRHQPDARGGFVEHGGGQALQQRDPFGERGGEIEFAIHRPPGDLGDMRAQPDEIGQLLEHLVLDDRQLDSHISVCTAVARVAKLSFTAFENDTSAVLFRAQYPWPSGIPSNWAVQAHNQIAEALFRRHLPSLPTLPAQAWIGGSSPTTLVVPVAPRSCYLAMVATSQGSTNDLTLAVTADSRWMADNSFDNAGAGVAFCVNQARSVKLDVDSRGMDVVWILGLWNVASGHHTRRFNMSDFKGLKGRISQFGIALAFLDLACTAQKAA